MITYSQPFGRKKLAKHRAKVTGEGKCSWKKKVGGWPTDILCEGPAIGSGADLEAGKAREREGGSERDLAAYRKPLWLQQPGRALRVMGGTQFVPL